VEYTFTSLAGGGVLGASPGGPASCPRASGVSKQEASNNVLRNALELPPTIALLKGRKLANMTFTRTVRSAHHRPHAMRAFVL